MARTDFITYLLNPKNWWLPLLIIFTVSITGVLMIGIHTYTEAPPIPDYKNNKGETIFSKDEILEGQAVFQKYALMEYGSMFGDGANRGPDYTAEALHELAVQMKNYYIAADPEKARNPVYEKGISEQVKMEIKNNRYQKENNEVILTDAQAFASNKLVNYYIDKFTNPENPGAFKPIGYVKNEAEIKSLTAFFFWGAWVCGSERPGEIYSYTHNWPFDSDAGNTPVRLSLSGASLVPWA